jgi:hypothetical protein
MAGLRVVSDTSDATEAVVHLSRRLVSLRCSEERWFSRRAGRGQNQRIQRVLRIVQHVRRIAMLLSSERPARASKREFVSN